MLIYFDPDWNVPVSESTTCSYHQFYPGKPFAGCCCSVSIGYRQATPEEYRTRKLARLTERAKELHSELSSMELQLQELT